LNTPTSPFSIEFLQAVNDWQRGGDAKQNRKRGESLRSQCRSLPETFRESPLVCHRQIALPKSGVWDLIGAGKLTEKVSSRTLDLEVAKGFKGGVPPKDQGYHGRKSDVHALWANYDPMFWAVSLMDGQFEALVSFTFNLVARALKRSTLGRMVNRGEKNDTPFELAKGAWA